MSEKMNSEQVLNQIKKMNGPLKSAIGTYYENQSAKTATNVLSNIVNANLLVPAVNAPSIPAKTQQMSFYIIRDKDNNTYFLAFTEEEEVAKWSKEKVADQQYLIFDFVHLVDAIERNPGISGYIINSNSQPFMVKRSMLLQMRDRLQEAMKEFSA